MNATLPQGVIARHATKGGASVDITEQVTVDEASDRADLEFTAHCGGCGAEQATAYSGVLARDAFGYFDRHRTTIAAAEWARGHAAVCQAKTGRCPTAHPDDPSPCVGEVVVTVIDRDGNRATGCAHHAARCLASLEDARVSLIPGAPHGTAARVRKTAADMRPFPWLTADRGDH